MGRAIDSAEPHRSSPKAITSMRARTCMRTRANRPVEYRRPVFLFVAADSSQDEDRCLRVTHKIERRRKDKEAQGQGGARRRDLSIDRNREAMKMRGTYTRVSRSPSLAPASRNPIDRRGVSSFTELFQQLSVRSQPRFFFQGRIDSNPNKDSDQERFHGFPETLCNSLTSVAS